MPPKEYCDGVAAKFQATWKRAEISNDDFIRTTEERHRLAVTEMWRRMVNQGDIYAADYEGLYCVGCEECKTDDELVDGERAEAVPHPPRPVERVKEKNYFFRLSAYQQRLLDFYAANELHPTRVALQRGGRVRLGRAARSVGVADVGEVGHPGARRSGPHGVRLDRRPHQLPDRPGRAARGRRGRPARRRCGGTATT